MNCPHCGFDQTRVVDTRKNADGVLRVRRCQQCRRTFDTSETIYDFQEKIEPIVAKKQLYS